MFVTECHNKSHVHTRTGKSHVETQGMVLSDCGGSYRHFLPASFVRVERAEGESAGFAGDREVAGEKAGVVMLTCEGKRLTVEDLAAAFVTVTLRAERRATRQTSKSKSPRVIRFADIGEDAKRLGVNRVTLYRALTGRWRLPGLVKRYKELRRAS
jgi:hypothetical protein